jgi:hypothetical protein
MLNGMPQPAWAPSVADKRPHLIHLGFASALDVYGNPLRVQRTQQSGVHRLKPCFILLECTQHRGGTDMQRSRCIAYATGIEAHVDDLLLHLRQTPAVAVVEQKTPCDARGILAQVALGPAARFAAFDDLLTVTMGTADGDEGHGPLLAAGHSQDWAQCAINRSPSPLLKHYRLLDT